MKRIICFVGKMDAGGAETFLMKIYRRIDKSKYQFDFLVSTKEKGFYNDEIIKLGGNIFYSPMKSSSPISNIVTSYKIVKKGDYYAALRMTSHSLGVMDLLIAKCAGVKNLIIRSTNAGNDGGKFSFFLHKVFSFLVNRVPNIKFAPSDLAAEYLFGKNYTKDTKVIIIKNGLPIEDYSFNISKRNLTRRMLGIDNKFVYGHIGRFNIQKNHSFLLDVFAEISEHREDAVLVLVGKGELETDIRNRIEELNLKDKVLILGVRKDIPDILMAMDCMLFPSFYEGMPNVLIEAQATGLLCLASDRITHQVKISPLISFLDINLYDEWVKRAVEIGMKSNREDAVKYLLNAGYDIDSVVQKFEKYVFNS